MTYAPRMVPELIHGVVVETPDEVSFKCIDCRIAGTDTIAMYVVDGTLLCMTHAVAERSKTHR